MLLLNQKIALVVGAATGIGAAVSRRLAREGATVVACGWPRPEGPHSLPCNVTQDEQVQATVAEVLRRHGRIDILVNAAGVIAKDSAATIVDAVWGRQHDINLKGTLRVMRTVLPAMQAQGAGSIVNIASVAAFNAGADSASTGAVGCLPGLWTVELTELGRRASTRRRFSPYPTSPAPSIARPAPARRARAGATRRALTSLSVARIVTRSDRKKAWMRGRLWTKVEI